MVQFLPFLKLKSGPFFLFLGGFIFQKSRSPCREKRIFEKQAKKQQKRQFLKLKSGPIMLRNITGPLFNFNLDHFLTLEFCYFFVFLGAETPIFIVFSAKHAKLKETQQRKKTLFVNTTVLTALVKMSAFFLHFSFLLFFQFPFYQRCFWPKP